MAKQQIAIVEGLAKPLTTALVVWLQCPSLARTCGAGQFLMIRRDESLDPYLRRPAAVHRVTPDSVAIYADASQPVYAWLSQYRIGDQIDVIGPCGRRVQPPSAPGNLALISQGRGFGPLMSLVDLGFRAVQMVSSVPTLSQTYPRELLPASIETATFVGREQTDEFWSSVAGVVRWAERIYAVGSEPFYGRLREVIIANRVVIPEGLVHVWIERDLACGVGACQSCTIPTRRGSCQVCTDGPFLDLFDVILP